MREFLSSNDVEHGDVCSIFTRCVGANGVCCFFCAGGCGGAGASAVFAGGCGDAGACGGACGGGFANACADFACACAGLTLITVLISFSLKKKNISSNIYNGSWKILLSYFFLKITGLTFYHDIALTRGKHCELDSALTSEEHARGRHNIGC